MATRIVKIGGSLLEFDGLRHALQVWLARQPAALNVLVAGGGSLVDAIRHFDELYQLGEEQSHWLSIRALSITSKMLSGILSGVQFEARFDRLREIINSAGAQPVVFDVENFLLNDEFDLPGVRLPRSWQTTSDSIAARLASVVGVGELVLLKSTSGNPGSLGEAAQSGYVDSHFPFAAKNLPLVRWVNLRDSNLADGSFKNSRP